MIAANDAPLSQAFETTLNDPCQLRSLIAHAAGLLAHRTTSRQARQVLHNVAVQLDDRPGMIDLAREVADRHGIAVDEIRGPNRSRWAVWPRQEVMYLAHRSGRFSTPQIGAFLGGRDHTTVLHGIRAHAKRVGL